MKLLFRITLFLLISYGLSYIALRQFTPTDGNFVAFGVFGESEIEAIDGSKTGDEIIDRAILMNVFYSPLIRIEDSLSKTVFISVAQYEGARGSRTGG